MYKTIFVKNIIIYMCLQHSNVCEFEIAVYLSLRERICSPKEFAPLRIFNLLLKEFAPLERSVSLCLHKQVVYSF